jgi:hypothetical protein
MRRDMGGNESEDDYTVCMKIVHIFLCKRELCKQLKEQSFVTIGRLYDNKFLKRFCSECACTN